MTPEEKKWLGAIVVVKDWEDECGECTVWSLSSPGNVWVRFPSGLWRECSVTDLVKVEESFFNTYLKEDAWTENMEITPPLF